MACLLVINQYRKSQILVLLCTQPQNGDYLRTSWSDKKHHHPAYYFKASSTV